jgi:hypothetical protein
MKQTEFTPGIKFMIEGSGCIYQYILTSIIVKAIICLENDEQCNIMVFDDHFVAYHFIGRLRLSREVKFTQLTLVP